MGIPTKVERRSIKPFQLAESLGRSLDAQITTQRENSQSNLTEPFITPLVDPTLVDEGAPHRTAVFRENGAVYIYSPLFQVVLCELNRAWIILVGKNQNPIR